jgi:ferredoxin
VAPRVTEQRPGERFHAGRTDMLKLNCVLCGECGGCVAVCPSGALILFASGLRIDHRECTLCENCVIFCPTGALRVDAVRGEAPPP